MTAEQDIVTAPMTHAELAFRTSPLGLSLFDLWLAKFDEWQKAAARAQRQVEFVGQLSCAYARELRAGHSAEALQQRLDLIVAEASRFDALNAIAEALIHEQRVALEASSAAPGA